jgi:oxygen-independent coproporphyrinogen III oxidase
MDDPVQRVHEQIDRELPRRHSNRVLHSHPSPNLWLERDVPVAELLDQRGAEPHAGGTIRAKRLLVYVGSPYCLPTNPDRCGFCLFPSEVYKGPEQLVTYLRYLTREGELVSGWFDDREMAALYFGGGTTNLYHPRQYGELMDLVRRVCPRATGDVEVTIEGVAQLFTRAKLDAMREAGVTRVSMGVQQLDPDLLKLSGRKQNVAHVLEMIEYCHTIGLGSSVDLIYSWPGQTVDHMLRDLGTLVEARVPHLTHYELNVAGRTEFARRRRDELPSTAETVEMYRVGKDFLTAHGYRQVTAYDWARVDAGAAGAYVYEELARTPFQRNGDGTISGHDIWGWGFASISVCLGWPSAPGWTFMNCPRVDDYFRCLDERRIPVGRGFRFAEADLRLYVLFQMLHGLGVDRSVYGQLFGIDPLDEHADIWRAVVEREWVAVEPGRIALVGDGVFYTPLIQGLLAVGRLDAMRRARLGRRVSRSAELAMALEVTE